jgi:N utilization substance protein A
VADAVAREKSIERDEVLEAMEQAISKAGRAKYGHEHDIRAEIDRKTGEVQLCRFREVTDEVEDEMTQISITDAKVVNPGIAPGEFVIEQLPPIDLGRIAAQMAKQVIVQKVREAERKRQFEEYKDRVGEIVNGIVKRNEFGNVTVDLGRAEGLMRRDETLPRESFRTGDRVRAYIYDVRDEQRGPQIFLSRSHPQFMAKLFAQEVPEIYDGIIELKGVARDPGSRAKIAVLSHDNSIDPVGACVGMRGSRVQAVVGELQGEKIDIIPWSPDVATFVVNALAPAEVSKVVLDEEQGRIEVVVPDDQLSLAIGRRGQNVRLASMLSGWDIDILTEDEESRRRQEEVKQRSQMFMDALDVDDVIAHLLVAEGFTEIEQVAFVPVEELANIEGFDEEVAEELRARGRYHLERQHQENETRRRELGVGDDLTQIAGLSSAMLVALGENEIKTRDDLADLASDELAELLGDEAPGQDALDQIIMAARAHWFADLEEAAEPGADVEPGAEGDADAKSAAPADADVEPEAEDDADAKSAAPADADVEPEAEDDADVKSAAPADADVEPEAEDDADTKNAAPADTPSPVAEEQA